jgi:hypothetical protein
MADGGLSQAEAEALLVLPKRFVETATIFLDPGMKEAHPLVGETSSESFVLDLWRGTIRLSRGRYQTRTRTTIVLARLDVNSAPHTNPDGERIGGTHLHLYREGYEARWAVPLEPTHFPTPDDLRRTLFDSCRYCSIEPPTVQEPLP